MREDELVLRLAEAEARHLNFATEAGGMAHDFNNLVAVMLGYCEMLLSDLDPGDPRREDIAEIEKAGQSAAALTQRFLDVTQLVIGGAGVDP